MLLVRCVFFLQAEDGIRVIGVTGVQTCALPILGAAAPEQTNDGSGPRRGRRTGLVAGAVVAVTAAIGVGAYGVAQLMSGGAAPATAVPADALGYVSLDLDPSASQKIEAISMLRKFP